MKTEDGRLVLSPGNEDVWHTTLADHAGVRLIFAYALVHDLKVFTCDLQQAYLQARAGGRPTFVRIRGDLAEALPDDVKAERAKHARPVHRLERALYGRKRSGLDCANMVLEALKEMGFERVPSQSGIFVKKDAGGQIVIAVYVDDMIVAASPERAREFFEAINRRIAIKKGPDGSIFSEADRFLGVRYSMKVLEGVRVVEVDMEQYSQHAVEQHEAAHGATREVQRLPDIPLPAKERSKDGHAYRSPVASLLWLGRCARPDILRAVCGLASLIELWTPECTRCLHALMGYVKATKHFRLLMTFDPDDSIQDLNMTAWSDASLAAPRSVSGCYGAITGRSGRTFLPLLWFSRKQGVCTTSSAAAEFVAASNTVEHMLPVKEAAHAFGLIMNDSPLELRLDNQPLIQGITRGFAPYDAQFSQSSRSVKLRICALHDLENEKVIKVLFEPTRLMVADGLTKILAADAMIRSRAQMNVGEAKRVFEFRAKGVYRMVSNFARRMMGCGSRRR